MKALILIFAMTLVGTVNAQETTKTVKIQTSAECGSCKKRIEEALNYTKGVKYAELDLTDKVVTVKYNTKKTSLKAIKTKISETGYAADEVKAIPAAVEKLPACCKPGGMKKKKG